MTQKKPTFSLREVLDAIDSTSDEVQWFANVETGEIAGRFDSPYVDYDDDEEEDDFENDQWIALPDRLDINDWEFMRDFAYAVGGRAGDMLMDAIHGRGAFRAFRRRVEELGALQSWYAYKDMRHLEIAITWLKERDLAWKDDVHEDRKRDWSGLLPAALATQLQLDVLPQEFSVCKLDAHATLPPDVLQSEYCFIGQTPDELSITCETARVPARTTAREDGWRVLKVAGPLDFGLVGILAKICSALADADVPVFAVSAYDTDYVLVKAPDLKRAISALEEEGCVVNR